MERQRHPDKHLNAVLREAEQAGWTVTRRKKYFMMWCPCADKHHKTVHLSPSDPNYERNLRSWLRRLACWGGTS